MHTPGAIRAPCEEVGGAKACPRIDAVSALTLDELIGDLSARRVVPIDVQSPEPPGAFGRCPVQPCRRLSL